jgi:hypothetical protein
MYQTDLKSKSMHVYMYWASLIIVITTANTHFLSSLDCIFQQFRCICLLRCFTMFTAKIKMFRSDCWHVGYIYNNIIGLCRVDVHGAVEGTCTKYRILWFVSQPITDGKLGHVIMFTSMSLGLSKMVASLHGGVILNQVTKKCSITDFTKGPLNV